MSKKRSFFLALGISALLSACSQNPSVTAQSDADYRMFLPIHPFTINFHSDLNTLPMAQHLENHTGLIIDYTSPMPGEEDIFFTFSMATQDMADLFRYDLDRNYPGGVDKAIQDGMIHDLTPLLETNAPNFMSKIQEYDNSAAFSDQGVLSQFGATLVDQELRGLANTGPIINKTYLDQAGLDIPETIADWEIVLAAFADMNVTPFSFGGEEGFHSLYDCFASAYGVTAGELLYQENGIIKCSPLQDGYYDFIVMMKKWYENGWISPDFYKTSQDSTREGLEQGKVAASVLPVSTLVTAPVLTQQATGTAMEFVAAPYPVLHQGDTISTREYTPDFYDAPIFIHSKVQDPTQLIQWIDFFYSDQGLAFSTWGIEGETYIINQGEQKEFTDHVTKNPEFPQVTVLAQETFQEMSLVKQWEKESLSYEIGIHDVAQAQWGKATFDNVLPETMTYSYEETTILNQVLYNIETYTFQTSVNFIIGLEPLENYDTFIKTLGNLDIEEVVTLNQQALNRYLARK